MESSSTRTMSFNNTRGPSGPNKMEEASLLSRDSKSLATIVRPPDEVTKLAPPPAQPTGLTVLLDAAKLPSKGFSGGTASGVVLPLFIGEFAASSVAAVIPP